MVGRTSAGRWRSVSSSWPPWWTRPAGAVSWETDPDFGYEVAASVPGVEAPEDGLLVPRLLYTRADRVYEHAAIVPRVRAEVAALIA